MKLSIILPALDEAANILVALRSLQSLRERGAEVIVVDGGSSDATAVLARPYCDQLVVSNRGRSIQQNAGAQAATGDTLLFLHVDTQLPGNADALIERALSQVSQVSQEKIAWGRFDVMLDAGASAAHPMLQVVAAMMNFRSRMTGIATGDQCIFVRKSAFVQVGGFPNIPLMEDIALSKVLKKISAPACLHERVSTSARRWQKHGIWQTIVLMWWLRLAYWIGVSPARLATWYR